MNVLSIILIVMVVGLSVVVYLQYKQINNILADYQQDYMQVRECGQMLDSINDKYNTSYGFVWNNALYGGKQRDSTPVLGYDLGNFTGDYSVYIGHKEDWS